MFVWRTRSYYAWGLSEQFLTSGKAEDKMPAGKQMDTVVHKVFTGSWRLHHMEIVTDAACLPKNLRGTQEIQHLQVGLVLMEKANYYVEKLNVLLGFMCFVQNYTLILSRSLFQCEQATDLCEDRE